MLINGASICLAEPLAHNRFQRRFTCRDIRDEVDIDRVLGIKRQLAAGVYDVASRIDACLDSLASDLQL